MSPTTSPNGSEKAARNSTQGTRTPPSIPEHYSTYTPRNSWLSTLTTKPVTPKPVPLPPVASLRQQPARRKDVNLVCCRVRKMYVILISLFILVLIGTAVAVYFSVSNKHNHNSPQLMFPGSKEHRTSGTSPGAAYLNSNPGNSMVARILSP